MRSPWLNEGHEERERSGISTAITALLLKLGKPSITGSTTPLGLAWNMPCSESHGHTSPSLDTFLLCEDQCCAVMHHVSSSSPHSNNRVYSLVCSINYGTVKVLYYSATLVTNGLLVYWLIMWAPFFGWISLLFIFFHYYYFEWWPAYTHNHRLLPLQSNRNKTTNNTTPNSNNNP